MTDPAARPLALVTGASRGIGAAVAQVLAPTHDLLLGGRDIDTLEAVAADLPGARAWPVELTDAGRELWEAKYALLRHWQRDALLRFPAEQRAEAVAMLGRLVEIIEDQIVQR